MGQTLSHGVYLPNEGERNCYAGLASNWQILNTAVGAIAEKAPLVHTHTVSQITDFPAYGNAAGTICEGNDSRLSDARTPVAHTHTKSDVTDLLNSDFIPSANNSYDLGSSSYQWNNAYIKSLTINGVACGDILTHNASEFVDANHDQTIGGVKTFSQEVTMFGRDINLMSRLHYGKNSNPSSNCWHYVFFRGNTAAEGYIDAWYSGFLEQLVNSDGSVRGRWVIRNTNENSIGIQLTQSADGSSSSLLPVFSTNMDLGSSTSKWKSFNGINPGALSIPDGTDSGANSSFTPDTTDWPKDGTAFQANMPIVGWLRITIKNAAGNYAFVRRGTAGANLPWQIFADPSFAGDFAECTLNVPVTNATYTLKINSPGGFTAKVYPCLGNV